MTPIGNCEPLADAAMCAPENEGGVLMVYLEPAPYIVGLVDHVRAAWGGPLDVVYLTESLTQRWGYKTRGDGDVLPPRVVPAVAEIRRRLAGGRYGLVHLAGWGHPVFMLTLLLARAMGLSVAIESDTPRPLRDIAMEAGGQASGLSAAFALPSVFLLGGSLQAAYLRDYGVAETRIRIAQMTVDVERIRSWCESARVRRGNGRARIANSCERRLLSLYGPPGTVQRC